MHGQRLGLGVTGWGRVVFRAVVEVQANEREHDAEPLGRGDALPEPGDRDEDDKHALEQVRDAVRDGRHVREDLEGEHVLRKVHGAVQEEKV